MTDKVYSIFSLLLFHLNNYVIVGSSTEYSFYFLFALEIEQLFNVLLTLTQLSAVFSTRGGGSGGRGGDRRGRGGGAAGYQRTGQPRQKRFFKQVKKGKA